MDRTTEDDDGQVGEATGDEGGESGRGAVVWVALGGAGLVVPAWAKGLARRRGKRYEKRRRKRHNLVNEGSSDYTVREVRRNGYEGLAQEDDKSTGVEKGSILKG